MGYCHFPFGFDTLFFLVFLKAIYDGRTWIVLKCEVLHYFIFVKKNKIKIKKHNKKPPFHTVGTFIINRLLFPPPKCTISNKHNLVK